jgi:hypothetical protein
MPKANLSYAAFAFAAIAFDFALLGFDFGASFFFLWLSRMALVRATATSRRSGRYPRPPVLLTTERYVLETISRTRCKRSVSFHREN